MNTWGGELTYVDDSEFRRASFNAWLDWEFLQRNASGCKQELTPCEMGRLCGKTDKMAKKINHMAIQHARVTQGVK